MDIEAPTMTTVDELAGLWVALARDQRAHGSHLEPEANRESVREGLARGIVTGGVLVARTGAEDENGEAEIAGFVQFSPETESYAQDVQRGVVENLYVRPEHRGDGVGSELLAAAEQRLFDAGVDRVRLEVLAANEAAREFYADHGYKPHRVELEKAPESDNHTKEH